ncbi:MAG: nuclear transport factor 2 family protein [Thermoleophilaceae bacterium]|nr:nuclear transport factor 2 family protein [Thermoleophilaceae bacterium]
MSQENIALALRYYERLNARDADGCLELLAPDVEVAQPDLPDGGVFSGREGWRRWHEALDAAWGEMRWEPLELTDAGDCVLATVRFTGKGAHTAIEHAADRFQVLRVRDGLIVHTTGFGRRSDALRAAGLPA